MGGGIKFDPKSGLKLGRERGWRDGLSKLCVLCVCGERESPSLFLALLKRRKRGKEPDEAANKNRRSDDRNTCLVSFCPLSTFFFFEWQHPMSSFSRQPQIFKKNQALTEKLIMEREF